MISEYQNRIDKLLVKQEVAEQTYRNVVKEKEDISQCLEDIEEAQGIVQGVAQAVQQQIHDRIAGVVSRCLEAVFDDPYEFQIVFEQRRGRTEARLVFIRDDNEVDPMTSSGGGVVDLASFALRLACLMLVRPALRSVLILDEPFRFVSVEYRPLIREMLQTLSEEMGVQFILVTHMEDLKMGTVVEIS